MVRLGSTSLDSGGDMKLLSEDAMDRAIGALGRFRQLAEAQDAALTVVATSAVREAVNGQELQRRAWREAGVSIEVISGSEEARLIHLGVLQAVPVYDRQRLVCDIGGGSTELMVGREDEVLTARSFKLGSIRLSERFFAAAGDGAGAGSADECRAYVRATLAAYEREVHRLGFEVAVGSSGTIGAVCSMASARHQEDGGDRRPQTLNNFVLMREDVDVVVRQLIDAGSPEERAALPGLDPKRADIILAGALILEQVMEALGADQMVFSDYALREGVLLDTWRRRHGGSLHHLSELRRRSVLKLAEDMDEDPRHSQQVARLALELFDVTQTLHGLGDDAREILEAAALLCNIGLYVSHSGHHKHSYYLIRHSEHLTGFTDREIELIAQVARYHRKSMPKPKHAEFAALPPDQQRDVRVLAGLLRVAVGLDRDHAGRVASVCRASQAERSLGPRPKASVQERSGSGSGAAAGPAQLVLTALAHDGEDVSLEIYAATQRKDLLEVALDVPVTIEAVYDHRPDGYRQGA